MDEIPKSYKITLPEGYVGKIKIIATPPGEAPEWVRKEWIGVIIPVPPEFPFGTERGVVSGKKVTANHGGYQVLTADALEALEKKSLKAAEWWKKQMSPVFIQASRTGFQRYSLRVHGKVSE